LEGGAGFLNGRRPGDRQAKNLSPISLGEPESGDLGMSGHVSRRSRRAHGRAWTKHVARLMPELRARADDCCELCGEPIDWEAPPRSRRSVSVDHIIPLHAGGQQLPPVEELRLAHVSCNARRGALTRARQRALVGQFVTVVELRPEPDPDLPVRRTAGGASGERLETPPDFGGAALP
jgi:HNH endonuclease